MAKFWGQWIVFIGCVTVSRLLCCVSCVIVTVTRQQQDIFTNPVLGKSNCYIPSSTYACNKRNAVPSAELNGLCICRCKNQQSTFFKTDLTLKCVDNIKMRNKRISDDWTYLLPGYYSVGAPIAALNLTFNTDVIEFKINVNVIDGDNIVQKCNPYKVEVADINGKIIWSQIGRQFESMKIHVSSKKYHDAFANLTLNWKANRSFINYFDGKIMRIGIKCNQRKKVNTSTSWRSVIDDFIIFKISGTLTVDIPEVSSDSSIYLIPSSSTSTPLRYPSTSRLIMSSSLLNVHSASTSSSQIMITFSSALVLTPSTTITSTMHNSIFPKATSTVTMKLPFSLTSSTTGIAYSSSVISSNPEKQSNDSSVTKAVTGAVVAVVLVLVVMAVLFYILRRRKERKKSEKNVDRGKGNVGKFIKNIGNAPLTALSNPVFQEGTYENPEDIHNDKKRQSGVNHIGSALYDQCLVVENPGARNVSLYDNVAQPMKEEHAYQALDPAKREPSAKYQSLIKPNNESSASVSESSSPEPLYSEVNDVPSRHLKTTSDDQPKASGVVEPLYKDDQPKASGVVEPLYNVLEVDGAEALTTEDDHVYNILEQSNKSEGKREPVYSVLDGEENSTGLR